MTETSVYVGLLFIEIAQGKTYGAMGMKREMDEQHSDPIMFLYFGLGVGYVAGLWVVFCAQLFQKVWRIAFFLLFDKVLR
jgi:hypothetical protein